MCVCVVAVVVVCVCVYIYCVSTRVRRVFTRSDAHSSLRRSSDGNSSDQRHCTSRMSAPLTCAGPVQSARRKRMRFKRSEVRGKREKRRGQSTSE